MIIEQLSLAALLIILVSALFLWWPRQRQSVQGQSRQQLFAEKLQLLQQARASGELAEADFAQAAQELKSQFAKLPPTAVLHEGNLTRSRWLTLGALIGLTAGIYAVTGQYQQVWQWQQAQQQLPTLGQRALLGEGEPLTDVELNQFALALRTKLANEGDDAVAWFVLGRIWLSQGRAADAVEAFEKALPLTPKRTNLLLAYAQALLMLEQDSADADLHFRKAAASLGTVLQQEPNNADALSMLALIAQERGDVKEAQAAWQLLLSQLTVEDPRYQRIEQQLAQLTASALPAVVADDTSANAPANDIAPKRVIEVELTIDPELANLYPSATLFVFARSVDGPPLPLAVQKLPIFAGARKVQLTSAMQMQAGWGLDQASKVKVGVRLSLTGAIDQQANDLAITSKELTLQDGVQQLQLQLSRP